MARDGGSREIPLLPWPGETITESRIEIDWKPFFAGLAQIPQPGESERSAWAVGFHLRMAEAAHCMILHARQFHKTRDVCLSGGVFMNRLLCEQLVPMLEKEGMQVHLHRRVPPNDGGISLGQIRYVASIEEHLQMNKEN
jgi:hydrogenase maturation protein HypF